MVLTTFPTDAGDGKVLVEITADTVCELGDVCKGEKVVVSFADWLRLKHNNKAVLATAEGVAPQNVAEEPAAEAEPVAEVAEISEAAADATEEAPAAPRKKRGQ